MATILRLDNCQFEGREGEKGFRPTWYFDENKISNAHFVKNFSQLKHSTNRCPELFVLALLAQRNRQVIDAEPNRDNCVLASPGCMIRTVAYSIVKVSDLMHKGESRQPSGRDHLRIHH